jgi:hypothetical protein
MRGDNSQLFIFGHHTPEPLRYALPIVGGSPSQDAIGWTDAAAQAAHRGVIRFAAMRGQSNSSKFALPRLK